MWTRLCLRMPVYFMAVGQFYRQFSQVTDEEVMEILRQESARRRNISLQEEG